MLHQEGEKRASQIDYRLNPYFIRDGLLAEFNAIAREGDNFAIELKLDSEDPGPDGQHIYIISNNGIACFELYQPYIKPKDGLYYIGNGFLSKCSDQIGSGTQNLNAVMNFSKKNGYDIFELIDSSLLLFYFDAKDEIDISLSVYKFLTIGNTWYSQFKLENINTLKFNRFLLTFIEKSFDNLIEKFNEKVIDIVQSNFNKDKFINQNRLNIEAFLDFFSQYIADINIHTSISDCFKKILAYIYTICPSNKCNETHRIVITKMKYFLNYIFSALVVIATGDVAYLTGMIDEREPQINSRVIAVLKNLKHLHFNLKQHTIGGKTRKRVYCKRNSKKRGKHSKKRGKHSKKRGKHSKIV